MPSCIPFSIFCSRRIKNGNIKPKVLRLWHMSALLVVCSNSARCMPGVAVHIDLAIFGLTGWTGYVKLWNLEVSESLGEGLGSQIVIPQLFELVYHWMEPVVSVDQQAPWARPLLFHLWQISWPAVSEAWTESVWCKWKRVSLSVEASSERDLEPDGLKL